MSGNLLLMYTVYHAFDTSNGKCYVGQTVREPWTDRRDEHLASRGCTPFSRALRKRPEAFVWTVLVSGLVMQSEADEAEIYWGNFFHSLKPEGYGLRLGFGRGQHSEESRRITSETTKAAMARPEVREKLLTNYRQALAEGRGRKGTKDSAEIREKRRQSRLASPKARGYKLSLSEESAQKIAEARARGLETIRDPAHRTVTAEKVRNMWSKMSEEDKMARRARISRSGGGRPFQDQNGTVYQTQTEAALKTGVCQTDVSAVLRRKRSVVKGFRFTYLA